MSALAAAIAGCSSEPAGGAVTPLTVEAYLDGKWPSRPSWSPDGRHLAFLWTDWRGQELYVAPAAGGAPIQLTRTGGFTGGPTWNSAGSFGAWSPDGREILYGDEGDLYAVGVPDGTVRRLTDTEGAESGAVYAPDGMRIAFTRGGNLFVRTLASGAERQLTTDGRAGGPTWSPDGRWLAFGVGDAAEWLTSTPSYVGSLITFRRPRPAHRDVAVVPVDGGRTQLVEPSPDQERVVEWSPDGSRLLIERQTIDATTRTLFACTPGPLACRQVFQHRDPKYLASNDQVAAYSPDGRWLMITSDQDGWTHVYRMPAEGGPLEALTSGSFEISFAAWSHDGARVYFSSTEAGTPERHLYWVAAAGGERHRLTTAPGVNTTLAVAPKTDQLAFVHSEPSKIPDLWSLEPAAGATPRQITASMTPALSAYPWQTPELVTFAGEGGLPIRAQLFRPRGLRDGVRYPAIVHVHQAAIYQEAYLGPGPQKDNTLWYGWHQRLADLGYVVLNVDFRGSYGYGRDFRTANHLDLGVGDAADVIKGVEFLTAQSYVDPARLGVYGMSYGGHMVLTLLSKYPDVFKAGINIAGVYDYNLDLGPWAIRNGWMYARLGSPDDNPTAYFNASSINFIDKMTAPLMTLQGTNDTNVTPLQSVKLVSDLLDKGKTFEFELYPGEVHFFGRRNSWLDAFAKMERFFERHLAAPRR